MRAVSISPKLTFAIRCLRSLPSILHIALLMEIIFYSYKVAGYFLFHDVEPTYWSNLPIALLSLFRIVTFKDWTDVMYTAMDALPWAWLYFIGVVLNNLEEAKLRRMNEPCLPPRQTETLRELRATQAALARLQKRMETNSNSPEAAGAGQ